MDVKHLNDFRPISLIGCQYKIIGKILANRLSLVIGDIVSQEQSSFIKGRQIMDGPLILNEVISWCKARKDQFLMFKVDFQKAFDSVRWDHLDDILGKFGFGNKTFAPMPDSGSVVPLLLHNADELYDSSTSCWNPAIRDESNACIELFASCRSLCKVVEPTPVAVEADADSLAIERSLVLFWIVFFA
ncbi:cysteine-rich receptor-like protein kinase [Tanacetum coccineum]